MKKPEFKITITYLIFGVLWLVISDRLSLAYNRHATISQLTSLHTYKGAAYVVVSALLIYTLISRAKHRLAKMEKEYMQLFLGNPHPMWIYDLETLAFLKVNKAAVTTYGYTHKEFLSMTIKDIRPDNEIERLTKRVRNLPGTMTEGALWTHKRKNGELLTVNILTHSMNFQHRKCRLVVAYDLSKVEQLEQELLKSDKEISILVNSVTDGFYIINQAYTILKHNRQVELTAESSVKRIAGENLFAVFPSLRNTDIHRNYEKAFELRQAVHFESFREKTKQWTRISAYPLDNLLSVFVRDITAEKESELRIVQSHQDLYALINNTKDLIWSIDRDYRFHIFNRAYKETYEKNMEEGLWIGKDAISENMPHLSFPKWRAYYERAFNKEKFATEVELTMPGKPVYYGLMRFNPILDADKEVTGVGCFLQDITTQKLHAQKIEMQNEKLKSIAHTAAHTLRPPLGNLLGFTKLLHMDLPDDDKLETVKCINETAKHLDRIIKDMVMQTAELGSPFPGKDRS